MAKRLTDAELIELVQEKLPEELSLAEIRQLHDRLRESSELKAVLIGQLHLETYLSTALAEINVSVDEIVRRADVLQQEKPGNHWPLWTGLAGLLLAVGLGIYFANRPDPEPEVIAQNPPIEESPQKSEPAPPVEESVEEEVVIENPPKPPVEPSPAVNAETNPPENIADPLPRGKPADPWFEALDPETEPELLAETAYRFPGWQRGEPLHKDEAEVWLKPVPGEGFRIDAKEDDNLRWVEINGVGKLQAPWGPDAVLRLSLFETENFRLHFWTGEEEGVTLWHYRERRPQVWAAYRSKRKNNEPLPENITALLTTDDGRMSRVRSGVVEFRYQDGLLVMSQGPARLLSVPLAGPPKEVIFDGRAMLSELAMYRGEAFPEQEPNPRPRVRPSTDPTDSVWMTTRPGPDGRSGFRELAQGRDDNNEWKEELAEGIRVSAREGTLQLAVEKSEEPVFVGTRLEQPGFYEIIFRIEKADPGTGFYFADDQGKELHRIGIVREKQTGQLMLDVGRGNSAVEVERDHERSPVAFFQPGLWVRAVWGFNTFKVWTSGDGIHWAAALPPARGLSDRFTTLGLMVQRTEEPRQISLAHLEIRELLSLSSLASESVRELAPSLGDLSEMDFGTWNQKVLAARPRDPDQNAPIPMDEWRRACAIRSLAESRWCPLSATLLRGLIEEGLTSSAPLDEKLRLLDEVSLLYDLWGGAEAEAMVSMYERLGKLADEEGHPDPFGLVVGRLMTAPIHTASNLQIVRPDFTREMLLSAAFERDWDALRSIARRTEFLMLSAHPKQSRWWDRDERELLVWAMALADRKAPEPEGDETDWLRLPSRGRKWNPPLVTQLSKEGYNVMAEFEAALTSDAYADACRIITSAGRSGLAGLLPDSKDPDLLVSLPRAIAIAMREDPELQTTMREQFGEIGTVRVREAMNRADVEAVEAATVRFYGTSAAAEAFRWLGDRALAGGKFAQAAQAYQEALPWADSAMTAGIQNRLRLAAGMLGHDVETENSEAVQIAQATWTQAEFDRLIEDLKNRNARSESSVLADWNTSAPPASPPPPTHYRAEVRGQFTGDLGRGAGKYNERDTDWPARQLAVTIDGPLMFVSNRFQVVCYQLADGKTKWSRGLGDEQGDINGWPFLSMQPLVVGDRVFVRRLTKRGPELACLGKDKGDVLWHVRPNHHVASDPVFVQNRLLALVATMPQSGMLQIDLTTFHPETGAVVSQQPLLSLRDEWNGCPPCQILAAGGKILCTIGGATLCCDSLGQPQWLQQHPWVPRDVDRDSKMQHHQPPIVADDRVYVSQAGVREVACFELATGRKRWSHPVPDLIRLAGIAGGNLVIQTENGLAGFDQMTGERLWMHADAEMLFGLLVGGDRLMYSRRLKSTPKTDVVCLIWLDPRTGEEVSHTVLPSLESEEPRFGPIVGDEKTLWAFFGEGSKAAERQLVALSPDSSLPPAGPLFPHRLAKWIDDVRPLSLANTAAALPGWLLTTSQALGKDHPAAAWLEEFRGEHSVLKTRFDNRRAVHLVREVSLTGDGPKSLHLKVGHEAGQAWQLRVMLGGETLLDQTIDDAAAPTGWLDRQIDLTPWTGQTVWLTVIQAPIPDQKRCDAYWNRLEVSE